MNESLEQITKCEHDGIALSHDVVVYWTETGKVITGLEQILVCKKCGNVLYAFPKSK